MERADFEERLASLRETRARIPEVVRNRHATRRRRAVAGHSARLLLVEADQAARGDVVPVDGRPGPADRGELLWRLVVALSHAGVDGVIGSADILDDLALLEVLDRKLAIGSMNRGGIAGSAFVMDDRFTGWDPDSIVAGHLDGGKMELRIDPQDARTADVMVACGRAVTALSGAATLSLIFPSWWRVNSDEVVEDQTVDALVRASSIAAGVGSRSAFSWLVLPPIDGLATVMRSVTLPTLIRADGPVADGQASWSAALGATGTRGIVLSCASLFPSDGDVAACVDTVVRLVHTEDELARVPR